MKTDTQRFFAAMARALKPERPYDPTPVDPVNAVIENKRHLIEVYERVKCSTCPTGEDWQPTYLRASAITSVASDGQGGAVVRLASGKLMNVARPSAESLADHIEK